MVNKDVPRHEEPCDELTSLIAEVTEMRNTIQWVLKVGGIGLTLFIFLVGYMQIAVGKMEDRVVKNEMDRQVTEKAIVRIDENLRWISEQLRNPHTTKTP